MRIRRWQWILLAIALTFVLDWISHRPDARTRDLNRAIDSQGSERLKSYPYAFHVLRVVGNTAVMATPRNFDVPAFRFLSAVYPHLNVRDQNDPEFIAAQKALGEVQSEARQIVLAQPGVGGVRWELDAQWLTAHGIELPPP
jgi:hypothetical protein